MLIPILVKGLVVEDDYTAHSSPLGHYIDFILFALKAVQAQRSASKLEDAFGKELSFFYIEAATQDAIFHIGNRGHTPCRSTSLPRK